MLKFFKYFFLGVLTILLIVNILIISTGKTYIYKGVAYTYLKGKSGPSIDEFELFPRREIKAGAPQEWNIAADYNTQQIADTLTKGMEHYRTISFLVIKDDSIRHERYWEGYDKDKLSNSFSMAKTIVGILTGVAIKEGKIKSLDQQISDFLPEFKSGKKSEVTVRHLLSMSSGVDFDEHYSSPFAYPAAAYYGDDLKKLTLNYDVGTQRPGTIFRYLSGDTQLMAFVLTAATGKSLSEYASEKLWKPMGASKDAYWNIDNEKGIEKAYCCFISNSRNFARFGKLFLNKGNWNGIQIVDTSYVEESLKPAMLVDVNGKPNNKYGLKWWLMKYKGLDIFYARGILGQYVLCIPEKNMIVVRLGHKRIANPTDAHPDDVYIYLDAALEMYE